MYEAGFLLFGSGDTAHNLALFGLLVLSLTVHEFGHAWTALRLGDYTAQRKGRGATPDTAHALDQTAPYTGAARAGEQAAAAEDYVKDRWQPLALLGASSTAFAVLATRLGTKDRKRD